MNELMNDWKRQPLVGKWQYLCLLVVAGFELLYISPAGQMLPVLWTMADYFLEIPAMVFLMLTIARGINRRGRPMMVLCLAMLLWISLVQVMRQIRSLGQIAPGEITCFYAMALPMAFALDDGSRQRGLNTIAAVYLLESLGLCILGGALYFGCLPEALSKYVYWENERLLELSHPTNCAAMLMIGIGLSLGLCVRTKKKWLRAVLAGFVALQFLTQVLTNGRTGMALTCLLIGGFVFCILRGTGWKRAPLAAAVSIVLVAALFTCSRQLFNLHQRSMMEKAGQAAQMVPMEDRMLLYMSDELAPEAEAPVGSDDAQMPEKEPVFRQGSFLSDLVTFNFRTVIWSEALKGVLRNPKILICGTDDVAGVLFEGGVTAASHTHNSYLETLYNLGIPGMLLALLFTVMALRAALILLWKNTDLWKSTLAVLVICMLGCGLLEPYLFVARESQHYLPLFFLTAVGYLNQWCVEDGYRWRRKA